MVFIIDSRGSMAGLEGDTIGGYNSLLEKQRKEASDATVTTVLFDDQYEMIHDHAAIGKVKDITNKEYIDAVTTAAGFGISADRAVTYEADSVGTRMNFDAVSQVIGCAINCAPIAGSWKKNIEEHKRRKDRK